jgi:hypothetical protein
LIGAFLLLVVSLAMNVSAIPGVPPAQGAWIIAEDTEFIGQTGYVEGEVIISPFATLLIQDSTLIVNHSVTIHKNGELELSNGTLKLDGDMSFNNHIDVADGGIIRILDRDGSPSSTNDASHITSNNSVPYNFTVAVNASFEMRNSMISLCGRPFADPFLEEGLVIRADDAIIAGSTITNCYYGIIIDQADGVTIENSTITRSEFGAYIVGTKDLTIKNTKFVNNSIYGALIRGFTGNMRVDSSTFNGNAQSNLHLLAMSGGTNSVVNCTFGPVGDYGMLLEEVADTVFEENRVLGCDVGIEIQGGTFDLVSHSISGSTKGLVVEGDAAIGIKDLSLTDTTISVDRETFCNISSVLTMTWLRVTGLLGTDMVVTMASTAIIDSSQISFRDNRDGATGLWALSGGTLDMKDTTIDSPVSRSLICFLADGSRTTMLRSTIKDLGVSTGTVQRMGMFVGGSGTIEEVTLADSLVGLVVGKSQTNIINLTIRDCLTGILSNGNLGRGGVSIHGLVSQGSDVAIRAMNEGTVTVVDGRFQLGGEGFNLTDSSIQLKDSKVSDPGTGRNTAVLRDTSSLNLVNTSSSQVFDIGPNDCAVNIFWYLNLTLKYLSDKSPLSDAVVRVAEENGFVANPGEAAGADGILQELLIRERELSPDLRITTPHTITVTKGALKDSFTITVTESMDHEFLMDNYPPTLTVDVPEDGSLHSMSVITFEGEAYDTVESDTKGLASMRYRVDGGEWVAITLPSALDWRFDATLTDGFHVVEIEVHDLIGNINSAMVSVELDTNPPDLTITDPEDGLYTNLDLVWVNGSTDPGANVTIDDQPVEVDANGSFSVSLTIVEGPNAIVVTATDELGNMATVIRNVTLDTEEPRVVFDQTGDLRTNGMTFSLSGSKKSNSSLYINGFLPQFYEADTFTTSVDLLLEGPNVIAVNSEDMAGNTWSTTFEIERDTTPPVLFVTELPEFTNKFNILVQGTIDDDDALITINGVNLEHTGGTFAYQFTLTMGANTLTVEAEDDLGNAVQPNVQTVNLLTTPPSLVITSPKYVQTLNDEHDLEGETDPGVTVSVHVTYSPYSKTYTLVAGVDGTFSVVVKLPQVGNHTVTVTVSDKAGNQASEELYYERTRQESKPPKPPKESSWFEDNWEYTILLAALVGAGAIWVVTLSSAKRRRERMARTQAYRTEEGGEEWGEEEEAHEAPDDAPEDDLEELPEEDDTVDESAEWEEDEEDTGKDE